MIEARTPSMDNEAPQAVIDAVSDLWAFKGPRPDNSFEMPEFLRLKAICIESYEGGSKFWFSFTLSEILRSLGCPVYLPEGKRDLALPAGEAAALLHGTLTAGTAKVVHLCPLDWANDPPELTFGGHRLKQFSASDLQVVADAPRLARAFPGRRIDWDRLSQFHWLIVEESLPITTEPGERTSPFMYQVMGDLGAIEAHESRFPTIVEQVLFLILLAPWEDWSEAQEVDWRGFRTPWVYSISDDLCVSLKALPSEDALTLVPNIYHDYATGEPVEVEEPARFATSDSKVDLRDWVTDASWSDLSQALGSQLFEVPVLHFLVRAYHAHGIDEFIAHLTVIEASLGLKSDYGKKPKGDPRTKHRVTDVMAYRVATILGDGAAASEYQALFDLRSAYVHGRPMAAISSVDRFRARRLARRVVVALLQEAVGATQGASLNREQFLLGLGVP